MPDSISVPLLTVTSKVMREQPPPSYDTVVESNRFSNIQLVEKVFAKTNDLEEMLDNLLCCCRWVGVMNMVFMPFVIMLSVMFFGIMLTNIHDVLEKIECECALRD